MNPVLRVYDRVIVVLGHVPGFIIAAVAVLITIDVLSRNLGFGGIQYTVDIVQFCILTSTMCGTAWVLRLGRHVRMDLITQSMGPALRHRFEIGSYVFAAAVAGMLSYFGISSAFASYQSGAVLYFSFDVPEWMPLAVVAFGFTLFTLESIRSVAILATRETLAETELNESF